jgi:dodecin
VTGSRRPAAGRPAGRMVVMADSVYRVTELVGTSSESWEQAAAYAVETASQTLRDLRIAEVVKLDLQLEDGQIRAYRTRIQVSFKYERGGAS